MYSHDMQTLSDKPDRPLNPAPRAILFVVLGVMGALFVVYVLLVIVPTYVRSQSVLDPAENGDLVRVKTLLTANHDRVFSKNESGETALHIATKNGHKEVVELLLANGADPNAKDSFGGTPLHIGAGSTSATNEVMELLLANKANVDNIDNEGHTPLHIASGGPGDSKCTVVDLLLANRANVKAKDNRGRTPLHLSVLRSRQATALLVAYGADVNAKDNDGMTPFDRMVNEWGQEHNVQWGLGGRARGYPADWAVYLLHPEEYVHSDLTQTVCGQDWLPR